MKQPKEGFYMGFKKMTENGEMVALENTYGLARTAFIWSAYFIGCVVIANAGIEVTEQAIKTIKSKIDKHKKKKNLESK